MPLAGSALKVNVSGTRGPVVSTALTPLLYKATCKVTLSVGLATTDRETKPGLTTPVFTEDDAALTVTTLIPALG